MIVRKKKSCTTRLAPQKWFKAGLGGNPAPWGRAPPPRAPQCFHLSSGGGAGVTARPHGGRASHVSSVVGDAVMKVVLFSPPTSLSHRPSYLPGSQMWKLMLREVKSLPEGSCLGINSPRVPPQNFPASMPILSLAATPSLLGCCVPWVTPGKHFSLFLSFLIFTVVISKTF